MSLKSRGLKSLKATLPTQAPYKPGWRFGSWERVRGRRRGRK